MRIERPKRASDGPRYYSAEVAAKRIDGRVCGQNCAFTPSVWIYRVPCSCSDGCPTALLTLSVDPYRYAIEPAIPPLVFEMKRLGMFSPCWSCGWHLSCVASISKLPKLWFYCD